MNRFRKTAAAFIASVMTAALLGAGLMHAEEEYLISSDDPRFKYIELDDKEKTIEIAASEFAQKGVEGDIVIPSVLDGKKVSKIAPNGFAGYPITSVVIPDGVEEIGKLAFSDCEKLKKAEIADSVLRVGADSFSKTELEKNILKNSDPNFVMLNENILYFYTGSEKNVEVPEGVRVIAASAFADNGVYSGNKIASVTMPESLEYIGDNCFENCDALKKLILRKNFKGAGTNAISKEVSIYGYLGSEAEAFSDRNKIAFIPLLKEGETKIESSFDKGFRKYYFSTEKKFSTEGIHIYKRYSDGTREELKKLKWSFDTTPEQLYAEAHKKTEEPKTTTAPDNSGSTVTTIATTKKTSVSTTLDGKQTTKTTTTAGKTTTAKTTAAAKTTTKTTTTAAETKVTEK